MSEENKNTQEEPVEDPKQNATGADSTEKKEQTESEPSLKLTVYGPCKSGGEYIGLRSKQRQKLGVKVGDKVEIIKNDGNKEIYTVGLGSDDEKVKNDPELFTANGINPGEKVEIKKFEEVPQSTLEKNPTKDIPQETKTKVQEVVKQEESSQEESSQERSSEEPANTSPEPNRSSPAETIQEEPENNAPPETAPVSAEQPQEEQKKPGLFSRIGKGIKNIITRNNPNDPLGFERQKYAPMPKTALWVSPIYIVGDILDGTIMNSTRRLYEIFSPFARLPKELKDKNFWNKSKTVIKAFGSFIGNTIKAPFKIVHEAYLGVVQKPASRIARIMERVPLVGVFAGAVVEGLAETVGVLTEGIGNLPDSIAEIAKGESPAHGTGTAHSAKPHTDEKEKSETEPNKESTGKKEPPDNSEEASDEISEAPKNQTEILEAIRKADYSTNEGVHKNTIAKYFDIDPEEKKITLKKDADLIGLEDKLSKSESEREKWDMTARKIIKFIRVNAYGNNPISKEQLKNFGLDKNLINIFEEILSEDFQEIMGKPLEEAA